MADVTHQIGTNDRIGDASAARADMKVEVVVIPVADVDRSKEFYTRLGWRLDADFAAGSDWRAVQFTPPGSGCSVIFGKDVTAATPGTAQGLYLVVSDIQAARNELLVAASRSARCSMAAAACTPDPTSRTCLGASGSVAQTPSIAATSRWPHSATQTAMGGCCRRLRRGCPGGWLVTLHTHRRTIWRARFAVRKPLTENTKNVSAIATRTGRSGTPSTWCASRPAKSCRNEQRGASCREHFDAIIIGTGQAGPSLAARFSAAGMAVAIIERHKFGGTCVNTGCIPTKTLVASAYAAHVARRGAEYGFAVNGDVRVDMKRVKARKDEVSGRSNKGVEEWLRGLKNCTVIQGHARFQSPDTVVVNDEVLQADKIFINVGGRASVPAMPGIHDVPFLTNSSMMDVDFLAGASRHCRRKLCWVGIRSDVSPLRERSHDCGDGTAPDWT